MRYAPRYPVEIVDRIGAGDSFVGGLIHGLLDGDPDLAIRLASYAAAIALATPGDINHFGPEDLAAFAGRHDGRLGSIGNFRRDFVRHCDAPRTRQNMNSDPKIIVTDAPDPEATAFIAENLAAYNESRAGFRDFRPLAILVSDPDTGELIGGLYGRTSLGVMFIDRFFLPEHLRGNRLGSRLLAMAEAEGRRRGCALAGLFTLQFQAPGFYRKQGWEIAAKLDVPPPGATRYLMTKKLG